MLGQSKSGKSSIIDAILAAKCENGNKDRLTVDEFKKSMTPSQYDLDFAIVNERIQSDFDELAAARNLKYFPVFKDDWNPAQVIKHNPRSMYRPSKSTQMYVTQCKYS